MTKIALCQCINCERYLAQNRAADGTDPQVCAECREKDPFKDLHNGIPGLPLAKIRGTLTDPLSLELLALTSEECGEVVQRIGKIQRWGWDADFEGTTQQHKLETELGDVLAAMFLLIHNDQITRAGLLAACRNKIAKLMEDAAGPRQRILHAAVPTSAFMAMGTESSQVPAAINVLREVYCLDCGGPAVVPGKRCQCDE